jgi:hypothetical protein
MFSVSPKKQINSPSVFKHDINQTKNLRLLLFPAVFFL